MDCNWKIRDVKKIRKLKAEFYNLCSSFHQELRISSRRWAGPTALLEDIRNNTNFSLKNTEKNDRMPHICVNERTILQWI